MGFFKWLGNIFNFTFKIIVLFFITTFLLTVFFPDKVVNAINFFKNLL